VGRAVVGSVSDFRSAIRGDEGPAGCLSRSCHPQSVGHQVRPGVCESAPPSTARGGTELAGRRNLGENQRELGLP